MGEEQKNQVQSVKIDFRHIQPIGVIYPEVILKHAYLTKKKEVK